MTRKQRENIEKLKIYLRRSKKKINKNGHDTIVDINSNISDYVWSTNISLDESKSKS